MKTILISLSSLGVFAIATILAAARTRPRYIAMPARHHDPQH